MDRSVQLASGRTGDRVRGHAGLSRLEVATDERVVVVGGWRLLRAVSAESRPQGGPLLGQLERGSIGKGKWPARDFVPASLRESTCAEQLAIHTYDR